MSVYSPTNNVDEPGTRLTFEQVKQDRLTRVAKIAARQPARNSNERRTESKKALLAAIKEARGDW